MWSYAVYKVLSHQKSHWLTQQQACELHETSFPDEEAAQRGSVACWESHSQCDVGPNLDLSSHSQSGPLPQKYPIYSEQACPNPKHFVSEVHVLVMRHTLVSTNLSKFE